MLQGKYDEWSKRHDELFILVKKSPISKQGANGATKCAANAD